MPVHCYTYPGLMQLLHLPACGLCLHLMKVHGFGSQRRAPQLTEFLPSTLPARVPPCLCLSCMQTSWWILSSASAATTSASFAWTKCVMQHASATTSPHALCAGQP